MSNAPPQSQSIVSGTGAGLLAYIEWAGEAGRLAPNTVAAYRTAVTQILGGRRELLSADVRGRDVEAAAELFVQSRSSEYQPQTLHSYLNRFHAAIGSYRKFLTVEARPEVAAPAKSGIAAPREQLELVEYPFPLRSDVTARFVLPRNLTRNEATRIAAFVASLAIDELSETLSRPGDQG